MSSFTFEAARPRRKPSLTPMIDVVFLLLIFFMLAARFGADRVIPLTLGTGSAPYTGPQRLIEVGPDSLRLNGFATDLVALAADVTPLMQTPGDIIVLRGSDKATTQHIVDVMAALRDAGFTRVVLVE